MRILITGITGMVGSHLAEYAVREHPEVEVHGLVRWRSPLDHLRGCRERLRLHEAELRDLHSLVRLLETGRYLSAPELGAIGHVSVRRARAIIAHLRADHRFPIVSTPADGYRMARSAADATHTLASLRSRIAEIQRAIDGIEAGVQREFGQQELFELRRAG